MPEIHFKGVNIHFTDEGKGPAVVLVHGFLESVWMWNDIVPALAKNHRVVCVDLPGHGLSDCIGYVHTMDEMAEAVLEVVRSLKLRKVSIVGHSMGGYVALAFAEQCPDLVRSLVLYQSTARSDSSEKQKDRKRAIELVRKNYKTFVRQSIPLLFRPVNRKRFKAEIDQLKSEALKTSPQGIMAALAGMKDRPNREVLLKFAPFAVHIIASDRDPRIPFAEAEEQSRISKNVRLHTIRGCGHMSYIEDQPETLRVLQAALSVYHKRL